MIQCQFQMHFQLSLIMNFTINKQKYIPFSKQLSKCISEPEQQLLNRDMTFPTMWYVRPAKTQINLRIHVCSLIRAFACRLNIISILSY